MNVLGFFFFFFFLTFWGNNLFPINELVFVCLFVCLREVVLRLYWKWTFECNSCCIKYLGLLGVPLQGLVCSLPIHWTRMMSRQLDLCCLAWQPELVSWCLKSTEYHSLCHTSCHLVLKPVIFRIQEIQSTVVQVCKQHPYNKPI